MGYVNLAIATDSSKDEFIVLTNIIRNIVCETPIFDAPQDTCEGRSRLCVRVSRFLNIILDGQSNIDWIKYSVEADVDVDLSILVSMTDRRYLEQLSKTPDFKRSLLVWNLSYV